MSSKVQSYQSTQYNIVTPVCQKKFKSSFFCLIYKKNRKKSFNFNFSPCLNSLMWYNLYGVGLKSTQYNIVLEVMLSDQYHAKLDNLH